MPTKQVPYKVSNFSPTACQPDERKFQFRLSKHGTAFAYCARSVWLVESRKVEQRTFLHRNPADGMWHTRFHLLPPHNRCVAPPFCMRTSALPDGSALPSTHTHRHTLEIFKIVREREKKIEKENSTTTVDIFFSFPSSTRTTQACEGMCQMLNGKIIMKIWCLVGVRKATKTKHEKNNNIHNANESVG